MTTVVNWVQDVDGRFEVSSRQHFQQVMHRGTLHTDSGTPPTDAKRLGLRRMFSSVTDGLREDVISILDIFFCWYMLTRRLISMATTVTWTQDVNGNYEVSSPEHLKQIMHEGALFTDAGSFPTDYWASGTNYIQTADIDLLGDSTDITPIGLQSKQFFGVYDGGEFKISNWSYDSGNPSLTTNLYAVGLFGYGGASLFVKNLKLTGIWTLQGFRFAAGFLIGYISDSSTSNTGILNIECDFADGTYMDDLRSNAFFGYLGVVGGYIRCPIASGVTVRGSVDLRSGLSNKSTSVPAENFTYTKVTMGGVFGYLRAILQCTYIQNTATFTCGISAAIAGGIIGQLQPVDGASHSNISNSMIGDITGQFTAGGIIGVEYLYSANSSHDNLVNSMTGNITCEESAGLDTYAAGGIFGYVYLKNNTLTGLVNYMSGNITAPNNPSAAGGLIGTLDDQTTSNISNSINAMNGIVQTPIIGVKLRTKLAVSDIAINTDYGLTTSVVDTIATSTTLPAGLFLTNTEFPDLPYISLAGTDVEGNSHELDFVYANLAGNASYDIYTHCILHTGDIQGPLRVNFDISESNTTLYTTLINYSTKVVVQNALTINSIGLYVPSFEFEARSVNVRVTIVEIPGAIGYNVTYEGPTGGEITAVSGVTTLEHNITGLEPDTAYTIKLQADTGTGYELTEELTTTTLSNVAANYDITDFQEENDVTDLTSLDATTLANLSSVLTELVSTGGVVNVSVEGSDVATTFVEPAGIVDLANVDGILLPFESSGTAGQTIDLTLSDTTVVPVTYDEVNNTISVESETYTSGDAIYLDGNKLEVFDYYGLTVVSVDVAPLLVEPGPINIPVVITEVPGAVGYKIAYVSPSGVETASLSGVTALEQNITGLVADTEYVIKLYADTGSGYVLTEELTTTTLSNVAANYDVNIFVDDGVFNLSSLPDATISNIAEVMSELFTTGDIVNVSLQGKPELTTSFINLGDELSIDAIDGVLLPFVKSSAPGQDVSVVLSDGSTVVGINFDEVVNTITVNGVTYSPGDSFILDGKKVSVVEY